MPGEAAPFDVFLSYNSRERPAVERIARKLLEANLKPWLDRWAIPEGSGWQDALADGLRSSAACAVFVGAGGIGDWARMELAVATDRLAKDREFRLFLVLLPSVPEPFDPTTLPPFLSIQNWVDLRAGIEHSAAFQSLVNAIKGLAPGPPPTADPGTPPYRGLQPFEPDDAEFFFGRERDIQRLVEKLKGAPFLAVLGPSGSGKSSLVRAGLVPALRAGGLLPGSEAWQVEILKPGPHPLAELAGRLGRLLPDRPVARLLDELRDDQRSLHLLVAAAGVEVLLVVDQFEEAFTLCADALERTAFFDDLMAASSMVDRRVGVVVTMRADFYQRTAEHPQLAQQMAAHQYLVGPMAEVDLRRVIEQPAWRVGLRLQPGLVDRILEDVRDEPGSLPLLEHALYELWTRRSGDLLTLEGYQDSGGVAGAVARRADAIHDALDEEQRRILRRILLRLTQLGEGTEDTRRRATLEELVVRPRELPVVEGVVRALVDARLLTAGTGSDTPVIDVAHEALIRGWPRLRTWLDEDRAGLRTRQRLSQAATVWEEGRRDADLLYRGSQLQVAEEWVEGHPDELNELEQGFLAASVRARHREREEDEARRREEVRAAERERFRRRIMLGLALALVIVTSLAGVAVVQSVEAGRQRERARSLQLVAQANRLFSERLDLGLLLALEGARIDDGVEARGALLDGLTRRPGPERFIPLQPLVPSGVATSPAARLVAVGASDRSVVLLDPDSGDPLGALRGHDDAVSAVALSGDGKTLVSGGRDGIVLVWDIDARTARARIDAHAGAVRSVSVSRDGRRLATAGEDQVVRVWQAVDGVEVGAARAARARSVALDPSGNLLAAGESDGVVRLWDLAAGGDGARLEGHRSIVNAVAFSPAGDVLVSGSDDRTIRLWDVAGRAPIGEPLDGHASSVQTLAFDPDGSRLASGSRDETIVVWDVARRQAVGAPLRSHVQSVNGLGWLADGSEIVSSGDDGTVIVWNVDGPRSLALGVATAPTTVRAVAVDAGGSLVALGALDGRVSLHDMADGRELRVLATGGASTVHGLAFAPDQSSLTAVAADGLLARWSVDDGTLRMRREAAAPGQRIVSALSADGSRAAMADPGRGAVITDVETGQTIAMVRPEGDPVIGALTFSPDQERLAIGTHDGEVEVWDVRTGRRIGDRIEAHALFVSDLAFSPDGRLLASGSDDHTIRLIDLRSGAALAAFEEHRDNVVSLAFSPDGRTLASGGEDLRILLWDVESRQPVGGGIGELDNFINDLAFARDGRSLVAAVGPAAAMWDADPTSWRRRACTVAGRNLTEAEWQQYVDDTPVEPTCPDMAAGS